jgi:hypothetical protein
MENENIKGIPYGISDYGQLRENNCYYVDKTGYLPEIERSGRYLFFIRPRRFGKSLFISMMHYYYDVLYKDRFKDLFEGTRIYENPTRERASYLVLSLNFSKVSLEHSKLKESFTEYVQTIVVDFILKYKPYLIGNEKYDYFSKQIEKDSTASDILNSLFTLCSGINKKLYVFIDEYDYFSNTILTASREEAYVDLTHCDGFLHSFFNVLKAGTGGYEAPVSRIFITGVLPIAMNNISSGFNIGMYISQYSSFNNMLGFTQKDMEEMINYFEPSSEILKSTPRLMELLNQWYGNYQFIENTGETLMNPCMIVFFINQCLRENQLPGNFIDHDMRINDAKLMHFLFKDLERYKSISRISNLTILKEIIEDGINSSLIIEGFSLEQMVDKNNFKSLLFYHGLLSIFKKKYNLYRMQIPNETTKSLYHDYLHSLN